MLARILCELQGLELVGDDSNADLVLSDAAEPEAVGLESRGPLVVVSDRRLRDTEIQGLRAAGADAVLDADASLLDLAFVFSDVLFGSVAALRRYARRHAGAAIELRVAGQSAEPGRLLGVWRAGAFLGTELRIEAGTAIELAPTTVGCAVSLRGRVAYVDELDAREGLAIEFALDDGEVAPKLVSLFDPLAAELEARSPSGRQPKDGRPGRRASSVGSTRL